MILLTRRDIIYAQRYLNKTITQNSFDDKNTSRGNLINNNGFENDIRR